MSSACASSVVAQAAFAHDQQAGLGTRAMTCGQASSSVRWPFSGSSRATIPDQGSAHREAVFLRQCAARLQLYRTARGRRRCR